MKLTEGAAGFSRDWVGPRITALISMEMQRGVVGDLSRIESLVGAVKSDNLIENLATLMGAARKAQATVVHCNAVFRADRKGSAANCPMLRVVMNDPDQILEGTPRTEIVPELGPEPTDFVFSRYHGVSPFSGTSLDITLRNLGVETIIATGVSVNLGVFGLCVEAVNLGYRVILPRDCVSGFPKDYADSVIRHSLSQLCSITTSAQLMDVWVTGA
jgi:nicotinamidase-related amidase